MKMKYLILTSEDEDEEIFYDLKDIAKIRSDYAENIFNEADMKGNDLKPLEMVTVIYLTDGHTATFRTAKLEMCFD